MAILSRAAVSGVEISTRSEPVASAMARPDTSFRYPVVTSRVPSISIISQSQEAFL
ncbi:MAG: hypothetical protein A4E30_00147 [Methanomassiliicoccales archaeon PtaB.Bin215]|nr:MAG: hypothetical protein A4E30_00147 [Methanomassiliicoccales archaeon PtaB.Bin215]